MAGRAAASGVSTGFHHRISGLDPRLLKEIMPDHNVASERMMRRRLSLPRPVNLPLLSSATLSRTELQRVVAEMVG